MNAIKYYLKFIWTRSYDLSLIHYQRIHSHLNIITYKTCSLSPFNNYIKIIHVIVS